MAFQLKRTWSKRGQKGWAARRGCRGWQWHRVPRAVQNLGYPPTGPHHRGEGCFSWRGDRGDSSWEVLALGCSYGFLLRFSTARSWGGQPLTLSRRLAMGMSSEIRVYCSCCQAGLLEHTSQGRKQKRRRLLFLKQASNKHLHVPSISQLYKTPETPRFPKCFLII